MEIPERGQQLGAGSVTSLHPPGGKTGPILEWWTEGPDLGSPLSFLIVWDPGQSLPISQPEPGFLPAVQNKLPELEEKALWQLLGWGGGAVILLFMALTLRFRCPKDGLAPWCPTRSSHPSHRCRGAALWGPRHAGCPPVPPRSPEL